ncbi:O-antigen ligase family protein [Aeromicrobium piscarium]|uniref:O-antigen ligase family protein n=1 Tax=Aeromicrobium piscarium TaxID=2590901 RepID=UPI00163DDA4D|nr:O-antigen ligase family protein [Aeromicrobium piscarium]
MPWTLVGFALYAVARSVSGATVDGYQNVAVLVTFVAGIAVTAAQSSRSSADFMLKWARRAAVIASLAFLITLQFGEPIYGERSFALVALLYLAVLIPHRPEGFFARLAPYLVFLALVASLSRTAAAIGLALMTFIALRAARGRLVRGIAFTALGAAAGLVLITQYAPFRDRFLGGDNAVQYGGLTLNTSGRTILWEITIDDARRNLWFGLGPGSSQDLITPLFRAISHPHNDYLRLLHDFGLIGLALFVAGYFTLMLRTFQLARATNEPIHWSATMGLLAVALAAVTDNPLVYPFVMYPLAALVGLSLARASGTGTSLDDVAKPAARVSP